jgi:hypothetical protein
LRKVMPITILYLASKKRRIYSKSMSKKYSQSHCNP